MVKTVDAYIDTLVPEKAVLVQAIRQLISSLVPGIEERLSFKIPFYHYFGMFCYINPVPEGIDIGFCRGKDLVHEFPQLEAKGRAMVASILVQSVKDIERLKIREVVAAAAIWNETARKQNIPMVKRKKTGSEK
jgi:uncharacterized protein